MKTFAELSKKELASLVETQVEAYIDIELATQGIVKPINVQIDYPNFVKVVDTMPEMDVTVYEVDGYTFPDIETATKVSQFIGSLSQVKTNYDYHSGTSTYYVEGTHFVTPVVTMKKMYSEAKYQACKEQLKAIYQKRKQTEKSNEETVESVIDYNAIDEVRYSIKRKVREALEFFARAEKIADDYQKYLSITNDAEKALQTLFTVYNIQEQDLKDEVSNLIAKAQVA